MNLREQYIAVLKIRDLQINSIKTYLTIFDSFIRYCNFIKTQPQDVSTEQILFYLSEIKSPATRRQAKGMLTNLYDFIFRQGFKVAGIPNPKRHHHAVDYLSTYELNLIFNSVKNIKQRTILKLQYACALRVSEVCKIKKKDFIKKFDGNSQKFVYDLRIWSKGGHSDIISVPEDTIIEIRNYYLSISEKDKESEYLFPGQFADYYSSHSVQNVINKAMRKNGIKKEGNHSTHLLRISRATHLLIAGIDSTYVQKLLRHKSINTTQKYYSGIKTNEMRIAFSKADNFLKETLKMEIETQQKQIKAA